VQCRNCGANASEQARFCASCGTQFPEVAASWESRRLVTILFADISGSTALGESLDAEAVRMLLSRHFAKARQAIERHGGSVEKFIGDAVMAVFGLPRAHEDDALRAVRAAIGVQAGVLALNEEPTAVAPLQVRIGVNTGEVAAGDPATGETLITGDTVNTAARLEQAAAPGEILLGETTHGLVRDAVAAERVGPFRMKGKSADVWAYRVDSIIGAEGRRRQPDAAIVGREVELGQLRTAWRDVLGERRCRLVTVVAPAGIGKSRLAREAALALEGGARAIQGRCLAYGEGITYWPIRELAHVLAGIDETDGPEDARTKLGRLMDDEPQGDLIGRRLATGIGLDAEQVSQEEIFWAIRRFLEAQARRGPLMIILEDLHWAEATLLDLVEHVLKLASEPILLLATARPELIESRPTWARPALNRTLMRLEPLDAKATQGLVDVQPGGSALPDRLRRRIVEVAGGNPLYIEEMVAMLREAGLLVARRDGWRAAAGIELAEVPPTIRALLAARLDQLPADERTVTQHASVVGRSFQAAAVKELTPEAIRKNLKRRLLALVRKELLHHDRGGQTLDDAYRFRHILIRDAAYQALSKRERAELHVRFADWLERAGRKRLREFQEIIGYHLEQAVEYRRDLRLSEDSTVELGVRAVRHLREAGRAAWARTDLAGTSNLLSRAVALARPDDPDRSWDLFTLSHAYLIAGDATKSEAALDETRRALIDTPDPRLELRVSIRQAQRRHQKALPGSRAELAKVTDTALADAEALNDPTTMAIALFAKGMLITQEGRLMEEFELLSRALVLAKSGDDPYWTRWVRLVIANRLFQLPIAVSDAIGRAEQMLDEAADDQELKADLFITLAVLAAMDARLDDARLLLADARAIFEDLGIVLPLLAADWAGASMWIDITFGDPARAEEVGREFIPILEEADDQWHLAAGAPTLAEAILKQPGRLTAERGIEAEHWLEVGRAATDDADPIGQAGWRVLHALLASHRGQHDEAVALAREAARLVKDSETPEVEAAIHLDVARVLWTAGLRTEGVEAAQAARQAAAKKEARALVAIADQLLLDFSGGGAVGLSKG
jgi:class 3 adenylate cyclase